jgi:hypothetical protein
MEQEKILTGQKQLQRWYLMKMVEGGKITLREGGLNECNLQLGQTPLFHLDEWDGRSLQKGNGLI